MIEDRWYQNEMVDALYNDVLSGPDCHPVGVAPTGTGKTHIIAKFVDRYLNYNPLADILILCDEQNVLTQNYDTLCEYFSDAIVGLYSVGLESREISKITVAGIQSVHRRSELFENVKIVIIDEAHAVTNKQTGMYRKFLSKLKANYVGLTATHFRLGSGYIHEGKLSLFNKLSYDLSHPNQFKRLQDEGYLSKIYSVDTYLKLDAEQKGISIVNGDFSLQQLSKEFDREEITKICCDEIIKFVDDTKRKKILIFAIDIQHADNIKDYLISKGKKAESVHSDKENKKGIIEKYKNDEYDYLVNVNILVKGFDEKRIDLIAILRSSVSPNYHVQSIGRGSRVYYEKGFDISSVDGRMAAIKAGPKQDCVVMDFAGNTDRLGPIDDVKIFKKNEKKTKGEPIVKTCPECRTKNHTSVKFCIMCNYEFQFKTNLNIFTSSTDVTTVTMNLRDDLIYKSWVNVNDVIYTPMYYKGKISSMRVIYRTDDMDFSEIIKPESKTWDAQYYRFWLSKRWATPTRKQPANCADLWDMRNFLRKPIQIYVDVHLKYKKILDYKFLDTGSIDSTLLPKVQVKL